MQVCGRCGSSFAEGVPLGMAAGRDGTPHFPSRGAPHSTRTHLHHHALLYVLNEALEMGAQAEEQKKEHRAQQGPGDFHQRRRRNRKLEEKLRIVDPW